MKNRFQRFLDDRRSFSTQCPAFDKEVVEEVVYDILKAVGSLPIQALRRAVEKKHSLAGLVDWMQLLQAFAFLSIDRGVVTLIEFDFSSYYPSNVFYPKMPNLTMTKILNWCSSFCFFHGQSVLKNIFLRKHFLVTHK